MEIVDEEIGVTDVVVKNEDCSNNGGEKVCDICRKSFRSAKALGGHMRVHVHQVLQKDKQFKPYDKSKATFKKQGKVTNNNTTCMVCFKKFSSPKAMYGHMRCHSDRTWRGANPPPPPFSSSSSPSNADLPEIENQIEGLALAAALTGGWAAKGIRGRKGRFSDDFDDIHMRAANNLMTLRVSVMTPSDQRAKKLDESEDGIKTVWPDNQCTHEPNGSVPDIKLLSSDQVEETKEPNKIGMSNSFSQVHLDTTPFSLPRKIPDFGLNEIPPANEDDGS